MYISRSDFIDSANVPISENRPGRGHPKSKRGSPVIKKSFQFLQLLAVVFIKMAASITTLGELLITNERESLWKQIDVQIPDFYAGPIETRIIILIVYLWSADVRLIYQILHDMLFIRRSIPVVFWSRRMHTIQGIDDMLESYGRLISSVVRYLHFRGIAKDEIILALTRDNGELQRREALAECISFKESRLMAMLN